MTDIGLTRWRSRPVIIEAVRLGGDADWHAVAAWCNGLVTPDRPGEPQWGIVLITPHGEAYARPGDWVVRRPEGWFDAWEDAALAAGFDREP